MAELLALQNEYRAWLASLSKTLHASANADALRAICDLDLSDLDLSDLDLSDLESVEPPRGFRRH